MEAPRSGHIYRELKRIVEVVIRQDVTLQETTFTDM